MREVVVGFAPGGTPAWFIEKIEPDPVNRTGVREEKSMAPDIRGGSFSEGVRESIIMHFDEYGMHVKIPLNSET